MATNTQEAINAIASGIVEYVDNKISNIPYVRTELGTIKSVSLTNGKYLHTVTVRNFDYIKIKSVGNNKYLVGSIVYLLVPNGQYNNMFILGHLDDALANIKGGTIDIGNGKFSVDASGNMTATSGKIGLFDIDEGFKYYNPESPTDVIGDIIPFSSGGVGGIEIGGAELRLSSSRSTQLLSDRDVSLHGKEDVEITSGINEGGITESGNISMSSFGGDISIIGIFKCYSYSLITPQINFQTPYSSDNVTYTYSRLPMLAPSYRQTSDKRMKKDIKKLNIKKASDFILSLKPCEFRYKENDEEKHHGFIAQEVKKNMYDDWSLHTGNESQTLAYTELIADMVATIQKQQEQIEELRKDIEILKKGE